MQRLSTFQEGTRKTIIKPEALPANK